MAWTDEQKTEAIAKYLEQEPTAETSTEIVNNLAEELDQTPNGLRMILIKAGVYVKKDPGAKSSSSSSSGGSKRVSKADAQEALSHAISAKGLEPDMDIIEKMTGKAAMYFAEVLVG